MRPNRIYITGILLLFAFLSGRAQQPRIDELECRNLKIGYEKTLELLRAPLRPDALIVYPDNAVTGAIQAILQLGICVPEELSVVFHRNVELPYFCPFAARFLDTRLSDIVDKLIESISVQEIQRKETVS